MENTKIEWADHTFNPWIGCTKVSDGCKHCYAEHLMDTRLGRVKWGPQGIRQRTSAAYWRYPLKWNKRLEGTGRRERVFCASLADVFEDRPELEEWRQDLYHLISETPNLDWLLLTKRPENVNLFWPTALQSNVWIGASVENQEQANKRVPELLQIPAAVRYLSCEPLVGAVDLLPWFNYVGEFHPEIGLCEGFYPSIDWVIVGGESGPQARPMHPDWACSLRDQCLMAGVPFLFKQWGEWVAYAQLAGKQAGWSRREVVWPDGTMGYGSTRENGGLGVALFQTGKKAAGRLLDGREWNEIPQVSTR